MRRVWNDDQPADEQRLSGREARKRSIMSVISDSVVVASDDGYYHILNTDETGSICGAITEQRAAADSAGECISHVEAERRGFQPCERCLTYPGDQ